MSAHTLIRSKTDLEGNSKVEEVVTYIRRYHLSARVHPSLYGWVLLGFIVDVGFRITSIKST